MPVETKHNKSEANANFNYWLSDAQPDDPEEMIFFYHKDHLGSSTQISDGGANIIQHIEYMPYGETFFERRMDYWNTPYKFNAKELDAETGMYYYGARYYTPEVSIWLSVDPLASERSWLSPYNYCQLNPVKLVDPTGMLDDGYTVDLQGNIEKVDDTGGDDYDVLYNKEDYDNGKKDYDETGTKSGMKINRGELSNLQNKDYSMIDYSGEPIGEIVTRFHCEVKTKEVADNLFKFLDKNTVVEWSNQNFTTPNGESVNVITTSREGGEYAKITQGYQLTLEYLIEVIY